MPEPKKPNTPIGPMTAEEFIPWLDLQPEGARYELLNGYVVEMQSERNAHNAAKGEIFGQFREQLRRLAGPCRPFSDGMAVRLEDGTVFEPDAMIRRGDPLGPDQIVVEDPLLVVEVTSPSTSHIDSATKRLAYFAAPSLVHMLILDLKRRALLHEYRAPGAHPSLDVASRVFHGGVITLEPPGLSLDLDAVFAEIDAA